MHIYFFRHGIAFDQSDWSGTDGTRPLTDLGKERTCKIIVSLKTQQKLKVDAIWTSPLVRAFQTAEIAGSVVGLPIITVDELASGTCLKGVQKAFLKRKSLPDRLMLVGHEPDFGVMIGELIGDPCGDYALKKAGIALLTGDLKVGAMKLLWKLDPGDILTDEV